MAGIDSTVKFLLRTDEIDGSQNFHDASASAHVVTAHDHAQVDTDLKVFTASALFDGTGDYLSMPDSADWDFAGDDFTIDFWFRANSVSASLGFFQQYEDDDNLAGLTWSMSNNLVFFVVAGGVATIGVSGAWTPVVDTWYHIAIVRHGNDWSLYVDGVDITDSGSPDSRSVPNLSASFLIGDFITDDINHRYMNGWLDEFRVSKGIARWTANFTPPTRAYSPIRYARGLAASNHRGGGVSRGLADFDLELNTVSARALAQNDHRGHGAGRGIAQFDFLVKQYARGLAQFDIRSTTKGRVRAENDHRGDRTSRGAGSLFDARTLTGWQIYARNIATGTVTNLGWTDEGNLTLSGVALADATYDIEARPYGNYWHDARSAVRMRVVISGGDVAAAVPPPVRNLRARPFSAWGRDILWTWWEDFNTTTPADFALWFADASPVDTSGDPDAVREARAAGQTHLHRYAQTAAKVVAICARDSSEVKGPVSELVLSYPSGTIAGPASQWGSDHA